MARNPRFAYLNHYPLNGHERFGDLAARGHLLELVCWRCGNVRVIAGGELVRRHGETATLEQIYKRLTCECGARSPTVDTIAPLASG